MTRVEVPIILAAALLGCSALPRKNTAEQSDPASPDSLRRDSKTTRPSGEFRVMLAGVYDFSPRKLNEEEREQKIKEMDRFWKLVSSDTNTYLPLLRQELRRPTQNPFFLFDGTNLLMEYSKRKSDLQLAADAYRRTELEDIRHETFFFNLHFISVEGVNTFAAIEKILDDPDFEVFIPQHVLTLGQDYSALYCLLHLDVKHWVDKLVARLEQEKDSRTIQSILLCLASSLTDRGRESIRRVSQTGPSEEIQEYAKRFLSQVKQEDLENDNINLRRSEVFDFLESLVSGDIYKQEDVDVERTMREVPYLLEKGDFARLHELRRKAARRVSDEALHEIAYFTALMQYSRTSRR